MAQRTPSVYQSAIYAWVREGTGNAVVRACPGSGKTTTLVDVARLIDAGLFLAFNKAIADELAARLPAHTAARTLHSLGFGAFAKAGMRPQVDDGKYRRLIKTYLQMECGIQDPQTLLDLGRRVNALRSMAQQTLTKPDDLVALHAMAAEYDVDTVDFAKAAPVVAPILERGRKMAALSIDYNDMIYLPIWNDMPIQQSIFVLGDEAQDQSKAQRTLLRKAMAPGARALVVGDFRQAIYNFAGADAQSMAALESELLAQTFPLSITYRLPRSHTALCAAIYAGIECRAGAPEGTIEDLDLDGMVDRIKAHWDGVARVMVCCRTTAPLVKACLRLIRAGVPAEVKGRDIAARLVEIVRDVQRLDKPYADLADLLYDYESRVMATFGDLDEDKRNMAISALADRTGTVRVIAGSATPRPTTFDELSDAIIGLFGDGKSAKVQLMTGHRIKGLEAPTVYLLRPDLLPHKMAKSPAALVQEKNLEYVMKSRSTDYLGIVIDPEEEE